MVEDTTTMVVAKRFIWTSPVNEKTVYNPGIHRDVPVSVATNPFVMAHLEGAPEPRSRNTASLAEAAQRQQLENLRSQIVAEMTPDFLAQIREEVVKRVVHEISTEALMALVERRRRVTDVSSEVKEALTKDPVETETEAEDDPAMQGLRKRPLPGAKSGG